MKRRNDKANQNNTRADENRGSEEALAQIFEEHINNNETEDDNHNMQRLVFVENDPQNENSAVMYYYNINYKE